MKNFKLKLENADPDEVNDILQKVEKSLGIRFENDELKDLTTFGQLCDVVASKLKYAHSEDCTSQQAFYKLRNAIASTLSVQKNDINLSTNLDDLFPLKTRRVDILQLEQRLGFRLNILRPGNFISGSLGILCLVSLIGLFFFPTYALAGMTFSIIGLFIADKLGTRLRFKTFEELVKKVSREHYISMRSIPTTVNIAEITKVLEQLFVHDRDMEPKMLTPEAKF